MTFGCLISVSLFSFPRFTITVGADATIGGGGVGRGGGGLLLLVMVVQPMFSHRDVCCLCNCPP